MQLRTQNKKIESAAFDALPPPETNSLNETEITIPMSDGSESVIRICRPLLEEILSPDGQGSHQDQEDGPTSQKQQQQQELNPLIVLFHGGGFVVGSNTQMAVFARTFATLYNATVASLSYRLAPEHRFPTAQDDAWDGVRWLSDASNAASLGANLTRGFVVGGVSAGGNLAISVTHRSLGEPTRLPSPITGLWSANPITTTGASVPLEAVPGWVSRRQNADAPCLSTADLEYLERVLAVDPRSPVFSPFAALCVFPALPAAYVQVAGMDPLRDDGVVYEAVAREMGVATRLDVYEGMPHGFFYYFPGLRQSERFMVDAGRNMGWLLGVDMDGEEMRERVRRVVRRVKGG